MKKYISIAVSLLLVVNAVFAQSQPAPVYPRTTGYISFVNPILSVDKNGATYNFTDGYSIGLPTGINVLKSDKIGFSFEVNTIYKIQRKQQ